MIYLQNYKVAVPVFGVNSRISYQTIRKPTVFEKSILQLLAKYRNDLGNQSIDQIASELKASSVFFIDGLRYLMDFNAVQLMYGLSLDEGATLTLDSFDITANGKKFLADNALPSSNKNESDNHYYHPISRKLVSGKSLGKYSGNGTGAIEAGTLNVTLATVEGIVEESIRDKWQMRPNTRIEQVESHLSDLLWENKTISLDIDNNGNLSVTSSDKLFRQWLDGADKEFLWTQVIQHCFSDSSEVKLPLINWQHVKSLVAIENAKRLKDTSALKLIAVRDTEENGKIPTIYLSAENRVFLQGNVLVLPEFQFTVNDSLYALNIDGNFKDAEVHSGRAEIYFAGQPRYVDLAVKLKGSELWDEIRQYLMESDDLEVVLFSSVLGVEQAVKRLPFARINEVRNYYERMRGVIPDIGLGVFKNKVEPLENLEELKQYQAMFTSQNLENKLLLSTCFAALIKHSLQERKVVTNLMVTPVLSELSKSYFAVQDMAGKGYFDSGDLECVTPDYRLLKLIDGWKTAHGKLAKTVPAECLRVPEFKSGRRAHEST